MNSIKRSQLEDILLQDCQLGDNDLVLISESDCHVDGTFVIHSLLSLYQKENYNICFLAISQSISHYLSVSKKIATDLKPSIDSNKLIMVDGLKLLGLSVVKDCVDMNIQSIQDIETDFEDVFRKNSLQKLLDLLNSNVDKLYSQSNGSPTVLMIDNISFLLTLGISFKDIVIFCHSLSQHLKETSCGTLVMLSSVYGEDDKSEALTNYFKHISSTCLEINSLSSGYCKDVHGELRITRKRKLERQKKIEKTLQFKISDKSIKLWALGLSSAVL
ncbi:hypothetical protein SNE40_005689 [Patella caerulea]|uniref:Elongator complex protein 6 n=1 Tax=Patella caerulea TaxID=87958 RepID=A0AAN8K452_PATCE